MKYILIEVKGGVAYLTLDAPGVEVNIFDWDNYQDATPEEKGQMIEALPKQLRDAVRAQL